MSQPDAIRARNYMTPTQALCFCDFFCAFTFITLLHHYHREEAARPGRLAWDELPHPFPVSRSSSVSFFLPLSVLLSSPLSPLTSALFFLCFPLCCVPYVRSPTAHVGEAMESSLSGVFTVTYVCTVIYVHITRACWRVSELYHRRSVNPDVNTAQRGIMAVCRGDSAETDRELRVSCSFLPRSSFAGRRGQ